LVSSIHVDGFAVLIPTLTAFTVIRVPSAFCDIKSGFPFTLVAIPDTPTVHHDPTCPLIEILEFVVLMVAVDSEGTRSPAGDTKASSGMNTVLPILAAE